MVILIFVSDELCLECVFSLLLISLFDSLLSLLFFSFCI